jgi:hypothetical protein
VPETFGNSKKPVETDAKAAKEKTEKKSTRQYEYLVIYVHFLSRLVKRLQSKAFDLTLDVTNFDSVKMAILRDPNNLQVRLIEMPDTYLNESGSKQV